MCADEMFGELGYYKQNYLKHSDYYNEKLEKLLVLEITKHLLV